MKAAANSLASTVEKPKDGSKTEIDVAFSKEVVCEEKEIETKEGCPCMKKAEKAIVPKITDVRHIKPDYELEVTVENNKCGSEIEVELSVEKDSNGVPKAKVESMKKLPSKEAPSKEAPPKEEPSKEAPKKEEPTKKEDSAKADDDKVIIIDDAKKETKSDKKKVSETKVEEPKKETDSGKKSDTEDKKSDTEDEAEDETTEPDEAGKPETKVQVSSSLLEMYDSGDMAMSH